LVAALVRYSITGVYQALVAVTDLQKRSRFTVEVGACSFICTCPCSFLQSSSIRRESWWWCVLSIADIIAERGLAFLILNLERILDRHTDLSSELSL
jgi:hypothetical protein